MEETKLGLPKNIEAAIAYSLPGLAFISGIVMLILETENKYVRFHAMQSFILFGFYGVIALLLRFIPFIGRPLSGLLGVVMLISWIILFVSALQGKYFKFPLIGDAIYEKIAA